MSSWHMCGRRCFNRCKTFANIDIISSKSYRNLGECGLLPFLMEAKINHESTGKLYAHCLLIRKLEWWIVHVIVSLRCTYLRLDALLTSWCNSFASNIVVIISYRKVLQEHWRMWLAAIRNGRGSNKASSISFTLSFHFEKTPEVKIKVLKTTVCSFW